jgi:hypothetical protein
MTIHRRLSRPLLLSLLLAAGCGGSDTTDAPDAPATAGSGGQALAGQSGAAGKGAAGVSGSQAGSSGGGHAGSPQAGSGGHAGTGQGGGGTGGQGGSAAGQGGQGGASGKGGAGAAGKSGAGQGGTGGVSAGGAGQGGTGGVSAGGAGQGGTGGVAAGGASVGGAGQGGTGGVAAGGASVGGAGGAGTGGAGMGGAGGGTVWGTFDRPFAADSLWNSYPKNPTLGDYQIPPTKMTNYFPVISGGKYSTAAFLASESDPPMTIHGKNGAATVNCPDVAGSCPLVIPHWPASVQPASGSDGHADIIDVQAGIIHSFWQLTYDAATGWHTSQYAWSPLAGSGWGDPAHFSQGARASGVCTIAGVMRISEADDGEERFHHALAMSLDGTAMLPGFVFPATLEDGTSATAYKGKIPMGSLLMLPPDFDTSKVKSPGLLKVIRTLQVYGARVVDTNSDTPFALYVENGSSFTVSTKPPGVWDGTVENQLFDIAHALRVLASSDGFIDGNGQPFTPDQNLNRMSMRGPWSSVTGGGAFDSWQQALVFPATMDPVTQTQTTNTWSHRTSWAPWTASQNFRFTVLATGGARLNLQFKDKSFKTILETGSLGDGESKTFVMPTDSGYPILIATSGVGPGSTVRGTLVAE